MNDGRSIFSGMSVLVGHQFEKNRAVVVEHGVIQSIIPEEMIQHHLPATHYQYSCDHYLVPGLVDLHLHGAGGHDVMDASVDALCHISKQLAAEGITGFLATTMTAPSDKIADVLAVIPEAKMRAEGAAILGVHLEGPFISREKMGAQQGVSVCLPDLELFRRWQQLSGDNIRLVTLAPELSQANEFIAALTDMSVIASVGHTNATYDQTMAAIHAGCSYATHLFNAMRGIQQREPGATSALLLSDAVMAEIIVDGKHLHPAICQLALRAKGLSHLLLVTDAMRAKCMHDGSYDLGGQMVAVKEGRATLQDGTLAGSVLRMPEAMRNMMKFTGCTLAEAHQLASYNPLKKLNLLDKKGSIAAGKEADLVVLDKALSVKLTMRGGKEIFSAAT